MRLLTQTTPWLILVCLTLLVKGCSSAPKTVSAGEQTAKTFAVKPGKANIYIYREPGIWGSGIIPRLDFNGQPAGRLKAGTFFVWEVTPGAYEIFAETPEMAKARLTVNAEAGQNYFVRPKFDSAIPFYTLISLHQTDSQEGQSTVRKCTLADSPFSTQ